MRALMAEAKRPVLWLPGRLMVRSEIVWPKPWKRPVNELAALRLAVASLPMGLKPNPLLAVAVDAARMSSASA